MSDTPMVLLSQYGLLKVEGPDAFTFLQGQLTACLKSLDNTNDSLNTNDTLNINDTFNTTQRGTINLSTITPSILSAYCNQKGRVRAIMRVFKKNQAYYLYLPKMLIANIESTLSLFGQFSEITCKDVSNQFTIVGLIGNANDHFNLFNKIMSQKDFNTIETLEVQGNTPRTIAIFPKALWQRHEIQCSKHLEKFDHWHSVDIHSLIPEIFTDTTLKFLPHSINLPKLQAVSFKKGCFTGQEIIARMEYRTQIKKHLVKGIIDCKANNGNNANNDHIETITPGTPITIDHQNNDEDIEIGALITTCFEDGKLLALFELKDEYLDKPLRILGFPIFIFSNL